jgi:isopropylmalate/homocitrate/citramalate synthase
LPIVQVQLTVKGLIGISLMGEDHQAFLCHQPHGYEHYDLEAAGLSREQTVLMMAGRSGFVVERFDVEGKPDLSQE